MKVDNPLGHLVNLEQKKEPSAPPRPPVPAPEPESETRPGDVVKLSERARLAARATELAQGAPEVRQEKVAELRDRLSAGTYNISAQVVAEALIRKSITEV